MTSTFSTFQRSWLVRSQIATDEGVPQRAIKATLLNDYNRVLAGDSPMSNQDAYAGMAAAGKNQVITGDPSGNGNIATNVYHDAQGIFTGIFHAPAQALHLGEQLFGGAKTAIEGRGLSGLTNSLSQIAQLVPGVTDAEQLAHGNINYIWQHPLYSVLDLSGVGGLAFKAADLASSASDLAVQAADHETTQAAAAGFITDDPHVVPVPNLSKDEVPVTLQNIIRSGSSRSGHPFFELSGRAVKNSSLGPALDRILGPYGLYGNRISEMVKPWNVLQKLGQHDFEQAAAPLAKAAESLSNPDDMRQFQQLLTNPAMGQTPDSILADPSIPNNVKQAYKGYQALVDNYNEHAIRAGHNASVTNPITGQQAVVGANSTAAKIIRNHTLRTSRYMTALDKVNKLYQDFDAKVKPLTGQAFAPMEGSIIPPGTLLNAHDFVSTSLQTMKQLDPTSLLDVGTGQFSKDAIRSAVKRYQSLVSDTGPLAKLEQTLQSNDRAAIKSTMSKVKSMTNSKFFNHTAQFRSIRDFISTYQKADRMPKAGLRRSVKAASDNAAKAADKMTDATKTVMKQWDRATADNYDQVIASIMANKIAAKSKVLPVGVDDLTQILDLLNSGELYPTKLQPFLSPKEWNLIRRDSIAEYTKLTDSGAKVFYVPHVKPAEAERVGFVRLGVDRLPSVASAKSRAIAGDYTIQHPYLGLAKAQQELIQYDRTDEFFEKAVQHRLVAANKIQSQAEDEWSLLKKTLGKVPKFNEFFNHMYLDPSGGGGWRPFDPQEFLHPNSRHMKVSDNVQMMISEADYRLLQHMKKTVNNPATRVWDESLGLFRNAVLTVSPRFFAHITLGGAFMTGLMTGPSIFKFLPEAHKIVQDGELPATMSHGTGYGQDAMDKIYNPTTFHQFLGGRTAGRLLVESIQHSTGLDKVAAAAHAYHGFLETWSDHYRAMAYLYGKNRAERKGVALDATELADAARWGLNPSEYEGVKLANKVLADINSKTPMERAITRFAFPFGGWSKHILRYVLQLPMDHPLRTNFLANLSEQSYDADTSGLPQYLFHLLFLGQPDSEGNVSTIDFRQWNPLRDVANYMTLSGIVTQLNPLASGILTAMGIDSTTGTPELYPQLQYSSFYGGFQVQSPTGNTALSMLGSYIPEFGVLDHFLKISSYTRSLAKTDPTAYNAQLWQSLNFPWVPQTVNVDQIISKQETDRLTQMKNMATEALNNNDPSYLNNIQGPWPYEGWYFSTDQLKNIITAANAWQKSTGEQVPASELLQTPVAPTVPLDTSAPATLASTQIA